MVRGSLQEGEQRYLKEGRESHFWPRFPVGHMPRKPCLENLKNEFDSKNILTAF